MISKNGVDLISWQPIITLEENIWPNEGPGDSGENISSKQW